jgi:ribonucleoside-diphosphate reductase alpha chain
MWYQQPVRRLHMVSMHGIHHGGKQMAATMQVRKRNGDIEPVDVNKIVRAVQRWAGDLDDVDPMRVATKTISGLYDGATTAELDRLSIQTAAEMIAADPQYSRLAARLLSGYIAKEVRGQGIASFSQSVRSATPRA